MTEKSVANLSWVLKRVLVHWSAGQHIYSNLPLSIHYNDWPWLPGHIHVHVYLTPRPYPRLFPINNIRWRAYLSPPSFNCHSISPPTSSARTLRNRDPANQSLWQKKKLLAHRPPNACMEQPLQPCFRWSTIARWLTPLACICFSCKVPWWWKW